MSNMNLINSVDRALKIIDLFTEQETELKLTEISKTLNLNKSTVHGLLKTLSYHGYITQDPENGKYKLGFKLVERANVVLNSVDLRKIAHPYLIEVAQTIGDTVHLVILEGVEAIYIDKVEGNNSVWQYSRVGKRAPLYCTAVGKSLLLDKEKAEIERISKTQTYEQHTEKTIKTPKEFVEEIQRVKELGFAVDNEELQKGLKCYAVPIYSHEGKVVASISVSGLSTNFFDREEEIVGYLKKKAREISERLGYKLF